ncbi:MAG: shikimate kinase, partial [Candidatus Sulfotelmatobacter sp.]
MGAGKSSVGRVLAGQLGWSFEDLDQRIERHRGKTIA